MPTVRVPNNWAPRPYQSPVWDYLERGGKRAVIRWHRRAGKDDVCLHWTMVAAIQRPANYWHLLPEYAQARKALWEAINPHTGKRRIDEAFPRELRKKTREDEMFIEFANGSTWRLVGSDRYDSLVGAPPAGLVFSEYALANPSAWDYLRPMLAENGGWSVFNSTVRGRNHFWKLGDFAKADPAWFFQQVNADESGVFTPEQLDAERRELVAIHGEDDGEARFRQEYFNDPDAALPGSYYGKLISSAERDGRVGRVPWEPRVPVVTAWDLGVGDSTAIWFCQQVGAEVRLIDYYEASGVGLDHYAKVLAAKPYVYAEDILPHDAEVTELGSGSTRTATLKSLGRPKYRVLPRTSVEDRINATRMILPRCWFDEAKCAKGLNALRQYQREWDDKLKDFKSRPLHDWSSHAADAFGYLAQGLKPTERRKRPEIAPDYYEFSR